jgi:Zn-dependent metalloprotease
VGSRQTKASDVLGLRVAGRWGHAATTDQLKAFPPVLTQWNARHGGPSTLIAERGTLTGPSTASPESIARLFLRDHAPLFRMGPADVDKLVLDSEIVTEHNGARHLTFRQMDGPRVVYGALLTVTIDRDGRIVLVGGTLAPGTAAPGTAQLGALDAVTRAAQAVGATSAGVSLPGRVPRPSLPACPAATAPCFRTCSLAAFATRC